MRLPFVHPPFTAITTSPFSFYKLNSTIRVRTLDFGLWDLTFTLFLRPTPTLWTLELRRLSRIWKNAENAKPTPIAAQAEIAGGRDNTADATKEDIVALIAMMTENKML